MLNAQQSYRATSLTLDIAKYLSEIRTLWKRPNASDSTLKQLEVSLGYGSLGVALFFSYFYKKTGDHKYLKLASSRISYVIKQQALITSDASFHAGITGVAWGINHCYKLLGRDATSITKPIDVALLSFVSRNSGFASSSQLDFMSGLAGVGIYFASVKDSSIAEEALFRIIRVFANSADFDGNVAWPLWATSMADGKYLHGNYNLGMAHGIPGVLGFLLNSLVYYPNRSTVRLFESGMSWLMRQQIFGNDIGTFSRSTGDDRIARLAWCYGDLSIALLFMRAGKMLDRKEWLNFGRKIAFKAAYRPSGSSEVVDAGLCHGSAGVAHLYHRLFVVSREELCYERAVYWAETLLDQHCDVSKLTSVYMVGGTISHVMEPGFFVGLAGIGLSLLNLGGHCTSAWDEALLLRAHGEEELST